MNKREKFIVKHTKLNFYKKLDLKINAILDAKLEVEDYSVEINEKINSLDEEVTNLAMELNLSDEDWEQFM